MLDYLIDRISFFDRIYRMDMKNKKVNVNIIKNLANPVNPVKKRKNEKVLK